MENSELYLEIQDLIIRWEKDGNKPASDLTHQIMQLVNPTDTLNEKAHRELGDYEFLCSSCGKIHKESAYCVAQRASGNWITHTCECGYKTNLEPYRKMKW